MSLKLLSDQSFRFAVPDPCEKLCCVGSNYVERFAIIVTALTDSFRQNIEPEFEG